MINHEHWCIGKNSVYETIKILLIIGFIGLIMLGLSYWVTRTISSIGTNLSLGTQVKVIFDDTNESCQIFTVSKTHGLFIGGPVFFKQEGDEMYNILKSLR